MTLPTTSQLIKKHQLHTKKNLGQNFILDKNFTDKIAKSAGDLSNHTVLEIGPGPGSLTRSILDAGAQKLIVIEKDQRCLAALNELKSFYKDRLEIINDDALNFDEEKFFANDQKIKIIANLPYNIGTPLIFKWLKIAHKIESMTLMLQKEVVQRITAPTNHKHYGRLSVMINFLCQSKMLFSVNNQVFSPPPKVTSAIVQITPRPKPLDNVNFEQLQKIVAAAFSQKRKMIKTSLKTIFQDSEKILKSAKLNPNLRAQNLTIQNFCDIVKSSHLTN